MQLKLPLLGLAAAGGLAFGLWLPAADAADHAEAPGTMADAPADLNDLYAWHTADSVVAILTYNPFIAAGGDAVYDADVDYVVHVDNDGDLTNGAEHMIHVRFGQNGAGDWGVQASGLPGLATALSGAVDTQIAEGDYTLWAGLADDPFFFDLAGFNSTLDTANADGSVDFDGLGGTPTDALAGLNTMAIVLEFPRAATADGATTIDVWATSARITGS